MQHGDRDNSQPASQPGTGLKWERTLANAVAQHLGIPASERFRVWHCGTVDGDAIYWCVACPHAGVPLVRFNDLDPFEGRTPTADELEELFADGGRVKIKSPPMPPHPVRLDGLRFVQIVNTFDRGVKTVCEQTVTIYCGRCPDCGLVLLATTSP